MAARFEPARGQQNGMNTPIILHGYFRSSASWRVRIGLALKGLAFEQRPHNLRLGEQSSPDYLRLNPQGFVPALEIDGTTLTQSMAILDYLDARHPLPPLLGDTAEETAKIRAFAQVIACDIHPLQNLKVMKQISQITADPDAGLRWAREVNSEGMEVCAKLLPASNSRFCFGDRPSIADICLIPQMANARRFGVEMKWDNLAKIEANCLSHTAFASTAPDQQPDFAP